LITPETETELADIVRGARAPLLVQGQGTKAAMLRPVQAAETLSTAALSGITLYAPNELIMTARAGTPLSEIEAKLAEHGQQMIAEPSHLFGPNQTIGGITGANISGPRRISGGAMRDHVLGVRAINGNGEILNFGGRVLKNVTGLDIAKLLTGSFGTLAVMSEITFKVLPVAEATGTIVIQGLDAKAGVAAMSAGLGSPFSVSAAAYLPEQKAAYLRIEEFAGSVQYRCEKLARQFTNTEILDTPASLALWREIRDCTMLPRAEALWRVSVAPSAGPSILRAVSAYGISGILDWGGGLVTCAGPATQTAHQAICDAARATGGVWWLLRAPAPFRAAVDVLPPEAPALAAIRARVQHAFDPRGIFNPLRLRAA
jgi:glycolate oxidase FAD binding subunit